MKQTATLHFLRMAPRKVRLVADLIRGMSVNEAEAQLLYERRRAAKPLLKLLRSAIANAKATKSLEAEGLFIESVSVDQGPMLKRSLPRARGSASPIQKKMSHVKLTLAQKADTKASRFNISRPKKVKVAPEEREKRRAKSKKEEGASSSGRAEKKGTWRKMFQRKSV